ncbi:MAG TPA: hypothetical protein VNT75_23610 [Symbiobacteriaceae bacterium]|nr:hypothetical protein [Symbiobacteriaceae bacterium]
MRMKVLLVLAVTLLMLTACRTEPSEQPLASDAAFKALTGFFDAQKAGKHHDMLNLLTPRQRGLVTLPGAQFAAGSDLKIGSIAEGNPTNLSAQRYLDEGYSEVRFFSVDLEDRSGRKTWTYVLVKDASGNWLVADWGV